MSSPEGPFSVVLPQVFVSMPQFKISCPISGRQLTSEVAEAYYIKQGQEPYVFIPCENKLARGLKGDDRLYNWTKYASDLISLRSVLPKWKPEGNQSNIEAHLNMNWDSVIQWLIMGNMIIVYLFISSPIWINNTFKFVLEFKVQDFQGKNKATILNSTKKGIISSGK